MVQPQDGTDQTTGRAIQTASGPLQVPSAWGDVGRPREYLTFLDGTTREGKLLIYKILTEKGTSVKDALNKELSVVNFLCTKAKFVTEETGEEFETIVTRLICQDGTWIETHSDGIWQCLNYLCQMFGPPPWTPALQLTPKAQSLDNGKQWYTLLLSGAGVPKKKG